MAATKVFPTVQHSMASGTGFSDIPLNETDVVDPLDVKTPIDQSSHQKEAKMLPAIPGSDSLVLGSATTFSEEEEKDSPEMNKSEENKIPSKQPKQRKSVGFAPEPEEDLQEHHRYLEMRKREKLKDNPFWKLPSELAYLDRKDGQHAVDTLPAVKTSKTLKLKDIPDRPTRAIKEISTVNKSTAINFHYSEFKFPLPANRMMVDIQYASVSTLDMTKLSSYTYNISDEKVGLGYNFVGVVSKIGSDYKGSQFLVGTRVFGCTDPAQKKGALQTCIVLSPSDSVIPINDDDFLKVESLDVRLSLKPSSFFAIEDGSQETEEPQKPKEPVKQSKLKLPPKESYEIEDVLTPMAKFATFGALYCRAKQSISAVEDVLRARNTANVLINGADTCLGYTIAQILASSLYSNFLYNLNVYLVVKHQSIPQMEALLSLLGKSDTRRFEIIPFDQPNKDLYLKGETVPIKYREYNLFCLELFEAVLAGKNPLKIPSKEDPRLDLFVDIIGSKKMFQAPVRMEKLLVSRAKQKGLSHLFGENPEPLFLKLMQPKSSGCMYVSYRDFDTPEPTYLVDVLGTSNKSVFSPWSMGWTLAIANLFVNGYTYSEKLELEIRKEWLEEGLQVFKAGELLMKVDKVVDWRNNFRRDIQNIQNYDAEIVFQVEPF